MSAETLGSLFYWVFGGAIAVSAVVAVIMAIVARTVGFFFVLTFCKIFASLMFGLFLFFLAGGFIEGLGSGSEAFGLVYVFSLLPFAGMFYWSLRQARQRRQSLER